MLGGGGGSVAIVLNGIVYIIHRIWAGDGHSILCTKKFVGSDSVSLWLGKMERIALDNGAKIRWFMKREERGM